MKTFAGNCLLLGALLPGLVAGCAGANPNQTCTAKAYLGITGRISCSSSVIVAPALIQDTVIQAAIADSRIKNSPWFRRHRGHAEADLAEALTASRDFEARLICIEMRGQCDEGLCDIVNAVADAEVSENLREIQLQQSSCLKALKDQIQDLRTHLLEQQEALAKATGTASQADSTASVQEIEETIKYLQGQLAKYSMRLKDIEQTEPKSSLKVKTYAN